MARRRSEQLIRIFEEVRGRATTVATTPSDWAKERGQSTAAAYVHSFTPVFKGVAQPWHAGVLHNRDPRFSRARP